MTHSSFNRPGAARIIDANLRKDFDLIEEVAKYIPEIRLTSYYMKELVEVSRELPAVRAVAQGTSSDALLALYRNEHDDQTLTEQDLLAALEGTPAQDPFEYWRTVTNQPDATIEDYNAAFTGDKGDKGDSAYTVWKEAQPDGTPTAVSDYLAAIKGEPGDGADVDLTPYATKTELDTGLAGKVTKDTYDEQRALLETKEVVATVKTTADTALANSTANGITLTEFAQTVMELGENPHLTELQIEANRVAREANDTRSKNNEANLGSEITRATQAESGLSSRITSETTSRESADEGLSTRIQTAQTTANNKLNADEVDVRADGRIDASIASGTIRDLFNNVDGSGLTLEDLALDNVERLCGVSGADTSPDSIRRATLTLKCDDETPTEGVAVLGGVIRFTANAAWNGKFSIDTTNSGTVFSEATQILGGNTGLQEWRFGGLVWDFSNTGTRTLSLSSSGSTFTPVVHDLTFAFDGELTRHIPEGQAVVPIEEIAKRVAPNLTPSVLQTHSATIAQQHPETSFTVNTGNNPLSTDTFTVPTKDANNVELSAITDGELVKFEVPFFFDTQAHEGFQPECGLVVKADGIVVKTYSFENNNLLDPTQLNLLTFYAGKGETLTFEPTVATSRYGDGSIAITVYPYFNLIRVLQLGVLYNAGKELAESVVAVQTAKQRLIDNAQDAQIGVLGEGTQALRDEYETSVARLEALEVRLSNPAYAVMDRATVSEPTSTTTTSTTRSALGDEWSAKLETGASPYLAPILFDLTTGGVSPSNVSDLDFLYVRDSVVYANVLTPFQASIPAHDLPGTVTRGGNVVSADNPIQISLGQDGHHRQTSLTLTPDPNNLPADGAEFHVDFHAVVGGNNRALYESNIVWGNGVPVQKEATNENGESVIVNSFQQGNQVIVQINETGAESLPIAGGYLSLYAHYDYTIPLVPAVNASSAEVKVGDQVDGHFVVLLETGAGAVSQSRPLVIHYGNGQSIATNRGAAYINFYTNNDDNVGNIYSTPYREDRTWDLTQLQANAEAGQADLGFFTETVTNHSTSKLTLDTGLEIINEDEEIVDVAKEIADLKKNAGAGGDAPNGIQYIRKVLTGEEIANGSVLVGNVGLYARLVGFGVKVLVKCTQSDTITIKQSPNSSTGGESSSVASVDLSLLQENKDYVDISAEAHQGIGFAGGDGNVFLRITGVDITPSDACSIMLSYGYLPLNPFDE